ncbi:MAG: hypothetical protein EA342_13280 [Leptolyngbya sp. LCM1.Bin17]|nr:MAG: hypothetical protein EA342_13280 [Leptolyngbya sp. LCM1.Bin17]
MALPLLPSRPRLPGKFAQSLGLLAAIASASTSALLPSAAHSRDFIAQRQPAVSWPAPNDPGPSAQPKQGSDDRWVQADQLLMQGQSRQISGVFERRWSP